MYQRLSIAECREYLTRGRSGFLELIELIYSRIDAGGNDAVWIHRLTKSQALAEAEKLFTRSEHGAALPLFGIPFAIKDNIDWAGHPTTAACPTFSYVPERSATVVQRLLDAGAFPIGKTNLDQFATGLNGTRSPYGAPRSVFNKDYISGGSSSGSAVAVAKGLVAFSLGTDTAGSGRVPAAFNGLVGLKPTKGRISCAGVIPACRSLDCVSVFTHSVPESIEVLKVVEGPDRLDCYSRHVPVQRPGWSPPISVGVPKADQLEFFGDSEAALLFEKAKDRVLVSGAREVEIDFAPFREVAELLYFGPWVAERLAAIEPFYKTNAEGMEPTVRAIIQSAERLSAVDAFRGFYRLEELRRVTEKVWSEVDCLMVPTTGTIYTVEAMLADPQKLNTNLSYYTNFVNLLDLCCIAVPAGERPNGLPFGVTFMAPAFFDELLAEVAQDWLLVR